ncbi:MAG: hypothetical protein DWQ05_04495 [Calditrichaeota bacterium]|nr:MAG: hypothetical protein DWQ05_04495 [Calditrichota bacterium]
MAGSRNFVDIGSKLLLPIVIAVIGITFNIIQERHNEQQLAADRATGLMTHLVSENPEERKIAIVVIGHLAENDQVPPELAAALISMVSDSDTTVAKLASGALTKVTNKDKSLENTITQTAKAVTAAFIDDSEIGFVTCRDVDNMQPVEPTDSFEKGQVWVWARVNAPRNEVLKLQWLNTSTKEILGEKDVSIQKNINGYRTYSWKNFRETGNYEVRLLNSYNQPIGIQQFAVK